MGSPFPTYFFNAAPNSYKTRSTWNSLPHPGSPRGGEDHRSRPVALLESGTLDLSSNLHSLSGPLSPLQIVVLGSIQHREAYLSRPPDLPSLPDGSVFFTPALGSSFRVRYNPGGLLFRKPLGTSYIMP